MPRVHDVEALLTWTDLWSVVRISVTESRLLSDYATVTRVPADSEPVALDEATHAVELAVRVRDAARQVMFEQQPPQGRA